MSKKKREVDRTIWFTTFVFDSSGNLYEHKVLADITPDDLQYFADACEEMTNWDGLKREIRITIH